MLQEEDGITIDLQKYTDEIELLPIKDAWTISDFKYFLMAEGDYVTAIGTWKINDQMQWDWVQTFRVENGKLVETWLPAMATEGKWALDEIPT